MKWSNGDHFVLYIDIMGFKEKVCNIPHKKLHKILWEFQTKNDKLKPLLKNGNSEFMRISHFSDSIIIASLDAGKRSLNRIIKAGAILMRNALEAGIALRGVITKGPLTFDYEKNLYFGKPIVDAYLLEGQINLYGIIIHHSAEGSIQSIIRSPLKEHGGKTKYIPIIRSFIPFKNGMSKHFCIAYHLINRQLNEQNVIHEIVTLLTKLYPTVSGYPRVYLDNTIKCLNDNQEICN